ncbi:hypothetical protein ACSLBF_00770 [Pseudoalteromonas sp. T1lg65]|uniref:hypothetical protein n=1 Tax=Pseudoalteromonas sp. T1lg65 TaxID=2077101 RepID=UPI003F790E54
MNLNLTAMFLMLATVIADYSMEISSNIIAGKAQTESSHKVSAQGKSCQQHFQATNEQPLGGDLTYCK